jgi:archaellin
VQCEGDISAAWSR